MAVLGLDTTVVYQIWKYAIFSIRQAYIHFVAHETGIIGKLFIFNLFIEKGRNRR